MVPASQPSMKPALHTASRVLSFDIIQRDELRDLSMAASYAAARLADERRQEMLDARKSFATETVFSHPSSLRSSSPHGGNAITGSLSCMWESRRQICLWSG